MFKIRCLETNSKTSYGSIVVDYRLQKEEPHRKSLTVGGNIIVYAVDVITPMSYITTEELIINSIISTPEARYMCCSIKYFYLGTYFIRYEYIKITIEILQREIIK